MAVVLTVEEAREILEYMEKATKTIDGEFGECRYISQLIADDDMPDMYYVLKERLGIPRLQQVSETDEEVD